MDASIALTLALAVLCDLLRQWDQLGPGLPILLGWLLEEGDDLEGPVQSPHQVISVTYPRSRPRVLAPKWSPEGLGNL